MLPFYMDHNVHSAIVEGLRQRNVDCLTAFEDGLARSRDTVVLNRATELGRILFTQDQDFLEIAIEWVGAGRSYSGIVYARQLHVTIGRVISDLLLVAEAMTADEMIN